MKFQKTIITSLSLIALSACVSSSKYDETVTEMENMRKSLGDTQEELTASQEQLTASQAEIATLRKIEAETKRRNEIYAEFVNKLQSMIDGGQLTVSIDAGRIVINLPDNVLFNSGSANLNPEGRQAITQVGEVLSQFSDRRFQIEGHTDNVPIKSARYPSNWELSTARALSVVHLLTEIGVKPENISAAGFGEYRPRADNETDEGKQLNRRIEIVMLPNLDILSSELPKVTSQ
jgi:chemotaxis protein MotB